MAKSEAVKEESAEAERSAIAPVVAVSDVSPLSEKSYWDMAETERC